MDDDLKKTLDEILGTVKALEKRITRIEEGDGGAAIAGIVGGESKKKSIRELLLELEPKDGVQTALVIGHYLETCVGMTSFNKVDIEKAFRAAKETPPVNVNATVDKCVKNGHLMETEEKKDNMKAWVVTRVGEEFIKNGLKKTKTD